MLDGKVVLVTGGTGSFGQHFTEALLERHEPARMVVFIFIPSMKIVELAHVIAPEVEVVGIRPGEKLHEVMVTADDTRTTVRREGYYAILPDYHGWEADWQDPIEGGERCPDGFVFSSETNTDWLSPEELRALLESEGAGAGDG